MFEAVDIYACGAISLGPSASLPSRYLNRTRWAIAMASATRSVRQFVGCCSQTLIPSTYETNIKVGVCHPIPHVDVIKAGSFAEGPDLSDVRDTSEGSLGLRRAELLNGTY